MEWQPILVVLPREFHGQRSLGSYSPWSYKESDTIEQLTHTHTHTHRGANLESVLQSKVSQKEKKQISYINAHIWNLEKWY